MFQVFNGSDPDFHQQFMAIQKILRHHYNMEIKEPQVDEQYLYWQDALNLTHGCALIHIDPETALNTLHCIAFHAKGDFENTDHIDGATVNELMDDACNLMNHGVFESTKDDGNLYDYFIRQFYLDIYLQFCTLCHGHQVLQVKLSAGLIKDSLVLGHWPYKALTAGPRDIYQVGLVDISETGKKIYHDTLSHPYQNLSVH